MASCDLDLAWNINSKTEYYPIRSCSVCLKLYVNFNTYFWLYLGILSTKLTFLDNLPVITNLCTSDGLLILHDIWTSDETQMTILHSMSEINCHREIRPCWSIKPATPGLQICSIYWPNQADLLRNNGIYLYMRTLLI